MNTIISNCVFGYECDQTWENLKDLGEPSIKQCERCNEPIFFCDTADKLMEAIQNKQCVAVEVIKKDKKILQLGFPSKASTEFPFGR